MSETESDILVIGGGIAGTAVAAHLSAVRRVTVLEMEDQPGYHSTGRSAALFSPTYGNPVIRALSRASQDFFLSPPTDFCDGALLKPRKVMILGRAEQHAAFERFKAEELPADHLEEIGVEAALGLCPVLRCEGVLGAVIDHSTADIEVHALQQGYLRAVKRRGGTLAVSARVLGLMRDEHRGQWVATTSRGTYRAAVLINAAGAWADEIGSLAGARTIGLEPRRRTAALIDAPAGMDSHDWPMVLDAGETFYFKPDAGLLLMSPADETPCAAGDAQADEMDVALAADRLETITTIEVRRIRSKWAGLRSFVPDRSPVVGYDADVPDFFWLAALGGYGIQTAPSLSVLAAQTVLRDQSPAELARLGYAASVFSPARLRACLPVAVSHEAQA